MPTFTSEAFLRSCLNLFKFETRSYTRETNLVLSFQSSAADEATRTFLQNLASAREVLVLELSNTQATTLAKLGCLDNYIPHVFQLLDSLSKSNSDVFLDRRMLFEWKGGLNTSGISNTYEEVIFDIIMVLHTKSLLHYALAGEHLAIGLTAEVFVQAGKHLRLAAGIMFYLQSSLIPRWVSARGRVGTPPESSEFACAALGHLFTAAAQVMALVKAMQDNTPPAVLAKLAQAVVKEHETVLDILIRHVSQEHRDKIHFAQLTTYAAVMREFFVGVVYECQAESLVSAGEEGIGIAIALCARGMHRLQEQKLGKVYQLEEPGLPRMKDVPPLVMAGIAELRAMLEATERSARKENDLIFHVSVPGLHELLPTVSPVLIMKPEPLVPPESPLITFSRREPPEPATSAPLTSASIFSFFTAKKP